MKKHFPKTIDDAIEIDRFRIELILGRKLAPFEELNYTYISNKVGEFFERHKGQPLVVMDYERNKFQFFMDRVHEKLDEERAKNNGQ